MSFLKNLLKRFKLNESLVSLVLGVLVVLVIGALVVNYFRNIRRVTVPETKPEISETTSLTRPAELSTKYTVKQGDNLWLIAEKLIGSGYNWLDIAKENNLTNPNLLEVGQEINVPKVEPIKPTIKPAQTITGDAYTVVKGDNLWQISLRAYGDGYQWVKIARENNLVNPNLIHSGNVLKLPR